MGLDIARSQPAGRPEAVLAGLKGNGDAHDLVPCLFPSCSPALTASGTGRVWETNTGREVAVLGL
jgi:hypothetical protein